MTAPVVKGWCPGALRPMMSGDGLVVRVKPMMGRLTRDQVLGLCDVAERCGNGTIDLTARANLQIRGVVNHAVLVAALRKLGLVDADVALEGKRNIIVAPFDGVDASGGGYSLKKKMHDLLVESMRIWPELPSKMGVALDLGGAPVLQSAAADFRLEMSAQGMILRAEGCATGVLVSVEEAVAQLVEMMKWFVSSGGCDAGRMKRHLGDVELPERFRGVAPLAAGARPALGVHGQNILLGAAFGQLRAEALQDVMADATAMRVTPWRMFVLEDTHDAGTFFAEDNPLMHVNACAGAPACEQGLQATRDLAAHVAPMLNGQSAHISGCTKGCAHPRTADVVIVGSEGGYDLVRNGRACDTPIRTGLTPDDILQELATPDAL